MIRTENISESEEQRMNKKIFMMRVERLQKPERLIEKLGRAVRFQLGMEGLSNGK